MNGNEFVFPQDVRNDDVGPGQTRQGGLTLRDYFAAQAIQGFCSDLTAWEAVQQAFVAGHHKYDKPQAALAAQAYFIADAMIAERSK